VPAEPQALRLLARAARGSMRDALSLTDQAIAFGGGELQEAGVRQMLGSVDRSHVFRLIEALAQGDGKTVVETSEALRVHGLSAAGGARGNDRGAAAHGRAAGRAPAERPTRPPIPTPPTSRAWPR
jgi:hypothetical protein